jgi:hypothetical protein
MDMLFTFMTSSSRFSRFDRMLLCRFFIVVLFGFMLAFDDIFCGEDRPEVVMDFRKEQAGLRQANPCCRPGRCDWAGAVVPVRQADEHHELHDLYLDSMSGTLRERR